MEETDPRINKGSAMGGNCRLSHALQPELFFAGAVQLEKARGRKYQALRVLQRKGIARDVSIQRIPASGPVCGVCPTDGTSPDGKRAILVIYDGEPSPARRYDAAIWFTCNREAGAGQWVIT